MGNKVNIPTVDNTKIVCGTILLSTCVTMKRDSSEQVVIFDGETLNNTLHRLHTTNNVLQTKLSRCEKVIETMEKEIDTLRRRMDTSDK